MSTKKRNKQLRKRELKSKDRNALARTVANDGNSMVTHDSVYTAKRMYGRGKSKDA